MAAHSPIDILDLIQKYFGYCRLWPLWPVCSQNQSRSYMPDPTSCIQFSSVFSKKALIMLCKTNLDPVCMAWSGFGQTDLVWKQAGVQKPPGLVSGRMNPACYEFPLSDLDSCTDGPDHIMQNQPGSDRFWLTVSGFGQNGHSPEACWGARVIWPTSGQCFRADPDQMWIGSGMFTGNPPDDVGLYVLGCRVDILGTNCTS